MNTTDDNSSGESRTISQNRHQWPYLQAFSNQLEWPINGRMQKISAEDFKDILTAAFRKEVPRCAMSLDGEGVVMLGQRTSKFSKKEFAEWMEWLIYISAEKNIKVPASRWQYAEK